MTTAPATINPWLHNTTPPFNTFVEVPLVGLGGGAFTEARYIPPGHDNQPDRWEFRGGSTVPRDRFTVWRWPLSAIATTFCDVCGTEKHHTPKKPKKEGIPRAMAQSQQLHHKITIELIEDPESVPSIPDIIRYFMEHAERSKKPRRGRPSRSQSTPDPFESPDTPTATDLPVTSTLPEFACPEEHQLFNVTRELLTIPQYLHKRGQQS